MSTAASTRSSPTRRFAAYYQARKADFKLDRPLVKGLIVSFPEGHRQAVKLKTLMREKGAAQQRAFHDICEKNNFTVSDFREQWTDFSEFLSYLPAAKSQNHNSILSSSAVQEMRDTRSHYYFRIDTVRREGDAIPLERVRATIRRILFNQRQGEVIRNHEEELLTRGLEENKVRLFLGEPVQADTTEMEK